MDLVILAGGLGSRFGGLKQIEPVDEFGNFIIDYSIYDAIRSGFDRIVFVIGRENYEIFKNTIGKRLSGRIKVDYVFQDNSNIPQKYSVPSSRTKPFGTAHAILCAKDKINDNFAVINADDYYGIDAIDKIATFLKTSKDKNEYAVVGYGLNQTLLGNGKFKRGVCLHDGTTLNEIVECLITQSDDKIYCSSLENKPVPEIDKSTLVSMNLFGFKTNIFGFLTDFFKIFLENNKNNLEFCEFFISTFLSDLKAQKPISLSLFKTSSNWVGMTYKEDCLKVKDTFRALRQNKLYPDNLWK